MTEPKRIQLRRTKGWQLPPNTVVVARPTKWGNPFKVGEKNPYGTVTADLRHAVALYLGFAPQNEKLVAAAREELAGKDLACWCPLVDENGEKVPCHADILLEWANGGEA